MNLLCVHQWVAKLMKCQGAQRILKQRHFKFAYDIKNLSDVSKCIDTKIQSWIEIPQTCQIYLFSQNIPQKSKLCQEVLESPLLVQKILKHIQNSQFFRNFSETFISFRGQGKS